MNREEIDREPEVEKILKPSPEELGEILHLFMADLGVIPLKLDGKITLINFDCGNCRKHVDRGYGKGTCPKSQRDNVKIGDQLCMSLFEPIAIDTKCFARANWFYNFLDRIASTQVRYFKFPSP